MKKHLSFLLTLALLLALCACGGERDENRKQKRCSGGILRIWQEYIADRDDIRGW